MKYIIIENNKVKQVQLNDNYNLSKTETMVETDKEVVCGQIYNKETGNFTNPVIVKTTEEKMNTLADQVSEIINEKCKSKEFYNGLGFIDGITSVSRHFLHPDAIELTKWSDNIWKKVAVIKQEILAGTRDVDSINLEYEMIEFLPNESADDLK